MRWDDTVMCVTLMSSIAATGQTTSATDGFHRHLTRARVLPSQVITHTTTVDATIIPSPAQCILQVDNVTTHITTAGRQVSVTRLTATLTTAIGNVTHLTITALASSHLSVNVTSTHRSRMTAVHADWLMVFYTLVHATTNVTAQGHCSSPVTASATKIRLKSQRRPIAFQCP